MNKSARNLESGVEETVSVHLLYRRIKYLLFFLVVLLGISGYRYWVGAIEPLDETSTEQIVVQIDRGQSRADIARKLERKGVIKSAFVFNYYARFTSDRIFVAGEYVFSPAQSLASILDEMQK